MKSGDIVLIRLQQATGQATKLRPALLLATLPGPYQNFLLCGISTQLDRLETNWDERIAPADQDFAASGLRRESAIRLSFLYAATASELIGVIGAVNQDRLARLRRRLIVQLQS
jgi:mRNA interferase MazF